MNSTSRRGFTRMEAVIVLVIIGVLLGILITITPWLREQTRREQCVANLSGMGKGFYTYCTLSSDVWPIAGPNSTQNPSPSPVVYYNITGRHGGLGAAGDLGLQPSAPYWNQLSTTRSMWILLKASGTSPKAFICPSSGDDPDTVGKPGAFWDFPARPGDMTADRGWNPTANNETCVSYGYQVPYGPKGKPTTEVNQRMVLAADKGPYGGVSLNNSQVTAPPASLDAGSDPKLWRPFNSPNHGGLLAGNGQNVLFADSHVEFVSTPIVGVLQDNIYTAWKRQGDKGDFDTRMHGDRPANTAPFNSLTPAADTDSLIYP
jgi:prepilin-type processing-associated H-X9-DG protein